MGTLPDSGLTRQFRALFGAGTASGLTDGQLLERFLTGRGEDAEVAFAALLARHGPMVLGVCRRALRDPGEAEDAFQATFLILVRKGRSVRVDDSLGRWLYGVSRRVAGRARARSARRRKVEGAAIGEVPARPAAPDGRELASAIDEELGRLAEPFRSAVVLCDLGGLSHEEAARDLRCPVGTVKSRLARGRERLRGRLSRRGFAPSALTLTLAAETSAPLALIDATIGAATRYAAPGGIVPAGAVPASALALAEGVLRTMTLNKIQTIAAASLMLALAGSTAAVVAQQRPGAVGRGPARAFNRTEIRETRARKPEEGRVTVPKLDPPDQEARLDAKVTFDLANRGLRDVKDTLEAASGLRILIDPKSMERQKLGWWAPQMDLSARDEPFRTVLDRWLGPLGMKWEGVWGGVEGIVHVTADDRIEPRVQAPPDSPEGGRPAARPDARPAPAIEDARLDARVTVDLRNRPYDEVIEALRKQTGVNIAFDPRAMNDLGIARNHPSTLSVEDVPLRSALSSWLDRTGLGWRFEVDVVLVTKAEPEGLAEVRSARRQIERLVERLENVADPKTLKARAEVAGIFDRLEPAMAASPGPAGAKPGDAPNRLAGRPTSSPDLPRESEKVSMPDYVIEPPDIITVEILQALPGRPISGEHLVQPDGKISLGYYGNVYVAGLTTQETKEKVILHLGKFLSDKMLGLKPVNATTGKEGSVTPKDSTAVFVDVTAYNSKVYYVLGDVGVPGRLPITGNETVLDAINYAGGLIPGREGADIRLVRPAKGGNQEKVLEVDLPAIQNRGESATNYQLFPGDRLVVARKPAPAPPEPPKADEADARIVEIERKLDLILKRLDGERPASPK